MLFYSFCGKPTTIEEGFDDEMYSSREKRRVFSSRLRSLTDEYNNLFSESGTFMFFVEVGEERIVFDAICNDVINKEEIDRFLITALPATDVKCREVLLCELRDDLGTANNNHFIVDDDEIFKFFDLEALNGRGFQRLPYGENLLEKKSEKVILKTCEQRLALKSFAPEIGRIMQGAKNDSVEGHPVHYIFNYCGKDARRELTRELLCALYTKGRLKSQRYAFVNVCKEDSFSFDCYDALCKSLTGGAVVVRFEDDDDILETDEASTLLDITDHICQTMQKYGNELLTVLCVSRRNERLKSIIYNMIGDLAVVELQEDLTSADKARKYFRALAKKKNVSVDSSLTSAVKDDELYLPEELDSIFSRWFNKKLRTQIYPQYAEAKTGSKEIQKEKPQGTAYDELMSMIGLTEAKSVIQRALDFHKFNKLYGSRLTDRERPSMHMVFSGSPGTAKTTVARLFARILKENEILSTGVMVEVGRSDLVGKYVGWTANIVKEKFRKARGGVLFIDEAYSLVDDRSGSFGDEAINTIVQEMENHRDDVVVIFAGYADKMEGFLNKNPGLRSRIAWHVPFPDYTAEELTEIADLIASKKGLTLTPDARERIRAASEKARLSRDFGNGRYIRNLMEQAKMNLTSRVVRYDPDDVSRELLTTIIAEDVILPQAPSMPDSRRRIGFGS